MQCNKTLVETIANYFKLFFIKENYKEPSLTKESIV